MSSNIKKEIEAAAVAKITCPSCRAFPGQQCFKRIRGGAAYETEVVKTHQRRLSYYVSHNLREKL